jgi:hypothetical protein
MSSESLPSRPGATRDRTWQTRRLGNHLLLSQADIELLNSLKPICAVCNKQVEALSWRRSINQMSVIFTVTCHGATEDTEVPFTRFHEIMAGAIQGAKAFGTAMPSDDQIMAQALLDIRQDRKAFDE